MHHLVSKSGHHIFIIASVIIMLVAAWTLEAILDPKVDFADIQLSLTMILKDKTPSLYTRDNLFFSNEFYEFYTPFYRRMADTIWQIYGTFEAGNIRLLTLTMSIYLIGMFFLVYSVSQNIWISLGLTIFASHYHITVGGTGWGVGELAKLGPRTIFMAFVPFVALLHLSILKNPDWRKGLILGLAIGILTNAHPISGLHLLVILLAWLILVKGNTFRAWLTALAVGGMTIVGAWPFIGHYGQNIKQPPAHTLPFETFNTIVAEKIHLYFYPPTFEWPLLNLELARPVLDILVWFYLGLILILLIVYFFGAARYPNLESWCWFSGGLATIFYAYIMARFHSTLLFLIVGLYVIYSFKQKSCSRPAKWFIILTGIIVLYSFAGYYLLTLVWQKFEIWGLTSLLVEYARGGRYIYLPIYLLAALAGGEFAKKVFGNRALPYPTVVAYLFLFIFALTLFGPLASLLGGLLPLPSRNIFQPKALIPKPAFDEVDVELYDWVLQNTPPDSLFFGCVGHQAMTQFRYKSQRSITHNWEDLGFFIHNKSGLEAAYNRYLEFEAACQKNYVELLEVAAPTGADYILFSSKDAVHFLPLACFSNDEYAVFSVNPDGCNPD